MSQQVSAEVAIAAIQSGHRIYLHSVAAAPQTLIKEMVRQAARLQDVEIIHLHTEGPAPYAEPQYANSFRVNCLFIGGNMRKAVQEGRADYTPVFLSEIPHLFRSNILDIDVALINVSPPDKHGFCSLGVTVEAAHEALLSAEIVIAQINPNMPRTHGDALVHMNRLTYMVEVDDPIFEVQPPELGEVEQAIGRHVASLVDDGATLQMGIGAIPDAVLHELHGHKDLGVHTEMFSDGLIPLLEKGVVNGRRKTVHPNKIVATFVMGTKKVYEFIDDNPMVAMLDVAYVNNPTVIQRNPKMTAINSAIEVDLSGQVCADSIGTAPYSGVGGQVDFMRGSALSRGGKPIIALPSRTAKGVSRIATILKPGAGVVTSRAHVHYVVTEHGIAYLHGKTLRERAETLIHIAHPDERERLAREARDQWKVSVRI
ncbi:MAG: acetyl-CoA hydrolase/transferase family protein [Ignavibacteria bacterium]|nr:acetyl-CoA hydrolase/transferase family protein [Ignavibacteria bacterium]MBP6510407.1 acetyl-CoA hydrolase/transferase family protein [Candidatus Kapabacteria bacterium]MBK6417688.1 acetyl-CoA hydrolase/transferase family protein [Ignavibacteria bacterium]MBK6760719.1 acetyl-CoA hydrolase/transferase family protein [Ignavibacteria bacterium]MBK7186562.1 acetyl-CoA hydrolase/transferase family protein [Ignavibacteria bacterium]